MKQPKHTRALLYAFMVILFTSCGSGGEEKNTTDTSSATSTDTTASATAPAVNTTITTPQSMMVVKHKVADFAKWKASYEGYDSFRLANGIHSYVIARGIQDSNTVLVAVKVDDLARAKAFAKDPALKEAMKKGGVTGAPSISFATMTFQDTVAVNSDIRSETMFSVKDWNAWVTGFEEGKQERLDNGITVRAYGHNPDDDHKAMLVTAITDTAKAFAYYKSDALKKRRAASGVVGEPDRFLFHIVQRY